MIKVCTGLFTGKIKLLAKRLGAPRPEHFLNYDTRNCVLWQPHGKNELAGQIWEKITREYHGK